MTKTSRRHVLEAAILGPVVLAAPPAMADDAEEGIEEITVVATRTPQEAFRVPQMVSVIDKDEIDDRLVSNISEIFQGVPGVQFGGGPRRTGETPTIRGLSGAGVLVLFDGARQSFLSGHDGRFFIDSDLLAGVEVVRGPSSALYGSGALGGVMAFRTLSASDLLEADETYGFRAKSGFQSVNDEALAGGTAFAHAGRIDLIGNVTYRNGGDIELGSGATLPADDDVVSGFFKTGVTLAPELEWTTSVVRFDNSAEEPNNGDFGAVASADNPLVDKDITNTTLQSRLEYNPANPWLDLDLTGYYTRNKVVDDEIDSPRIASRKVETVGLRLDNRSRVALGQAGSLIVTYGGEYYEDEQTGFDSETADNSRGGVPNATTDFFGAYAQAELDLETAAGRFLFIPAVRFDRYENSAEGAEDNNEDSLSPKFSLSWEPADWLLLFSSYSEAFRAPTFNEVFADGIHFQIPLGPGVVAPNFFVPNTELKSESSDTIEFGGGLDFADSLVDGDRFQAKASYYQSDVDNFIGLEVDVAFSLGCFLPGAGPCTSGTSRNANTAKARLKGVELEASYDSARVYATATYSSIDGRDRETGAFVGTLSPRTFYVDAGLRIPEADLRLGSRAEIAGALKKVNDPALRLDAFEKVDIYAVWEPSFAPLRGLRIDLALDNVGDENFDRIAPGATAPGRNFQAAIRYTRTF